MPSSTKKTLLLGALCLAASDAFTVQNGATRINTSLQMANEEESSGAVSRRSLFQSVAAISVGTVATTLRPDFALAGTPPTAAELERIRTGYKNICYLLDNFEAETTVCRENGGECKRDADAVRKYLGLRSTTDPLFQIEKVFNKVKYMDIDPDEIETFFEATEEWNTAQNMSNSMAFISQFGEYNPGGGKDEVLKYLEEAKKQVVLAKSALEKIIKAIDSVEA